MRPDADLALAISETVDGSFFNAGQSCCGIERIYVHDAVFDEFVDGFVAEARPRSRPSAGLPESTIRPMVNTEAADFVQGQIAEAIERGGRLLVGEAEFPMSTVGTPYLGPSVLVDVHHSMQVMTEESFGPVIGIARVNGDAEAVGLMNASTYGLTASIWTNDTDAALTIGDQIETGTWYMNRCDYLDPALAWTGVKDTGRGCTLSVLGFGAFTRPKWVPPQASI